MVNWDRVGLEADDAPGEGGRGVNTANSLFRYIIYRYKNERLIHETARFGVARAAALRHDARCRGAMSSMSFLPLPSLPIVTRQPEKQSPGREISWYHVRRSSIRGDVLT